MKIRDTHLFHLHPLFAGRLVDLMGKIREAGLPFEIFEGYRPPERQRYLYRKGRPIGRKVTDAQPWQSMHQYGLAADLVLHDPDWTWRSGPEWKVMHRLARECGLRPLASEMPHVQMPGEPGRYMPHPRDAGSSWLTNLESASARYPKGAPDWLSPTIDPVERPHLGSMEAQWAR